MESFFPIELSQLTWMLPAGSPAFQAATLGLATFVQEDLPTVTAAVLAATGRLSWATAFWGCFLGIWSGDALLYVLARGLGRPMMNLAWARRLASPAIIAQSEGWFAERGLWLLAGSRFVPGTRLPTYLAAGFLRVPFGKFLWVTGCAVAFWTGGLFLVAWRFGPNLTAWIQRGGRGIAIAVIGVGGVYLAIRWIVKALATPRHRVPDPAPLPRTTRLLHTIGEFTRRCGAIPGRWTRWEFWPAWFFYIPVVIYYAWLSLKYRGITLPSAANPGITAGGLVGESKIETLRDLFHTSPEFTAEAWLLEAGTHPHRWTRFQELIDLNGLTYPVILKPDLGQRGLGVRLIRNPEPARDCLNKSPYPLVLQRYVPGPFEVGIFYYRFPGEVRGRIFAITDKVFPVVEGDGIHTLEELIWRDDRARMMASSYLHRWAGRRGEILGTGESLRLVEAGNHAQGCIFRDGSRLLTPALEDRIDAISQKVPGFFIGRYDVRFSSEEDLRTGRNFSILELNGASAEATSIYDARNSIGTAYRTLFRQWDLVFAIGAANRRRGAIPTSVTELLQIWRSASRLFAGYPAAD